MDQTLFQKLPIYRRLNPEEAELFEIYGLPRILQKGDFLFKEGDPGRSFWVVLSGRIGIYKIWGDGVEKLLRTSQPGDFIGELSVVRQNHIRTATARAEEEVHVLEVATADLEQLLRKQSNLALPLLRDAFTRFLQTENDAVQDLMDKNERLSQSLIELKAAQSQLIEQEKIEHDLEMARQIQESFLPHEIPEFPGCDVAVKWQPARQVGGDFFDFVKLENGKTAILIGDVSGKGVPAALVMAVTRSIVRALLQQKGTPGEQLARINDQLVEQMPPAMFVTAFLAIVDPATWKIEYANAGHCLPVYLHDGKTSELMARGMPFGLLPEMEYEQGEMTLLPEGTILLFSDALLESHNIEREMFGKVRLHAAMQAAGCEMNSSNLINHMADCLLEFTGPEAEQEDDLTMIVLHRRGPSS
jgi:serine phosphatase RsbU (regulator of sigma subunit)